MKPSRRTQTTMTLTQGFIIAASLCVASQAAQAAPGDCYLSVGSLHILGRPLQH